MIVTQTESDGFWTWAIVQTLSYLPELCSHLDRLLADRERVLAAAGSCDLAQVGTDVVWPGKIDNVPMSRVRSILRWVFLRGLWRNVGVSGFASDDRPREQFRKRAVW